MLAGSPPGRAGKPDRQIAGDLGDGAGHGIDFDNAFGAAFGNDQPFSLSGC
jgi:hypothetical protein